MPVENNKSIIKIIYLARWDRAKSAGAMQKVENTVAALKNRGHEAIAHFVDKPGVFGHLRFALSTLTIRCDLLIVRGTSFTMLLCIPGMILQRLRGAKVIIDLPNPISSVLLAISTNVKSTGKSALLKFLIHLNFPLSAIFANRIIQYGNEDLFTMNLVAKKTVISGNGIDTSLFKKKKINSYTHDKEITLIAVAKLDDWHGYDRIINGIANYVKNCRTGVSARFLIVGDGDASFRLKNLSKSLDLEDHVIFTGALYDDDLNNAFAMANVAIGPLGAHRIGLSMLSSLKVREYLARGLPIVMSGCDTDLPSDISFVFKATESDDPVSIEDIIDWYLNINKDENLSNEIQDFANRYLDYKNKVHVYTDVLQQ